MQLVEKYEEEFSVKIYEDFLEYIDTTNDAFHAIVDQSRSPHLWKKENESA